MMELVFETGVKCRAQNFVQFELRLIQIPPFA